MNSTRANAFPWLLLFGRTGLFLGAQALFALGCYAGVLFQPLRGIVFALVFFPLRQQLFDKRTGWLLLWWLLVGLGILATFGPAPGSIEGLVYTVIPWTDQVIGWLEVVPQAFLLSLGLWAWVRHSENRWLNWALGVAFVIVMLLPVLGLLVTP